MKRYLSKLLYINKLVVLVLQILLAIGSIACVVLGIVFVFQTGNYVTLIAYLLIAFGGILILYLLNFLRKLINNAEREAKEVVDRLEVIENKLGIPSKTSNQDED